MARDKKRIERRSLNLLLSADGFAAPLQVEERERPDFLVCYEDRSVGVEITEVMKNPQMRGSRAWEGNAGAVLVAAESEWESRGLSPVSVAVTFDKGATLAKTQRPHLAARIVALVAQVMPLPGQQKVLGIGPEHLRVDAEVPTEVRTIIVGPTESRRSSWTLSTGGSIRPLSRDLLVQAISQKDALVPEYRKAAPELWLVLTCDLYRYSSSFDLSDATALDGAFETAFDRIYFIPIGHSHIFELELLSI